VDNNSYNPDMKQKEITVICRRCGDSFQTIEAKFPDDDHPAVDVYCEDCR
jgi:hypothetical protein